MYAAHFDTSAASSSVYGRLGKSRVRVITARATSSWTAGTQSMLCGRASSRYWTSSGRVRTQLVLRDVADQHGLAGGDRRTLVRFAHRAGERLQLGARDAEAPAIEGTHGPRGERRVVAEDAHDDEITENLGQAVGDHLEHSGRAEGHCGVGILNGPQHRVGGNERLGRQARRLDRFA